MTRAHTGSSLHSSNMSYVAAMSSSSASVSGASVSGRMTLDSRPRSGSEVSEISLSAQSVGYQDTWDGFNSHTLPVFQHRTLSKRRGSGSNLPDLMEEMSFADPKRVHSQPLDLDEDEELGAYAVQHHKTAPASLTSSREVKLGTDSRCFESEDGDGDFGTDSRQFEREDGFGTDSISSASGFLRAPAAEGIGSPGVRHFGMIKERSGSGESGWQRDEGAPSKETAQQARPARLSLLTLPGKNAAFEARSPRPRVDSEFSETDFGTPAVCYQSTWDPMSCSQPPMLREGGPRSALSLESKLMFDAACPRQEVDVSDADPRLLALHREWNPMSYAGPGSSQVLPPGVGAGASSFPS